MLVVTVDDAAIMIDDIDVDKVRAVGDNVLVEISTKEDVLSITASAMDDAVATNAAVTYDAVAINTAMADDGYPVLRQGSRRKALNCKNLHLNHTTHE